MIVDESSILLAALEQRLQVGRVLPVDPFRAAGAPADGSPGDTTTDGAGGGLVRGSTRSSALPADDSPLAPGRIIAARVVDVQSTGRIVLALADILIELDHAGADEPVPQAGQTLTFRVLSDRPVLTLQTVPPDTAPTKLATGPAGPMVQWSADVLRLQVAPGSQSTSSAAARVLRFDVPLLDPREEGPLTTAISHAGAPLASDAATTMTSSGGQSLDATATAARAAIDTGIDTTRLLPLVFQGPAWIGQSMELVVRREAADETMANPALDQWCGEVMLDLPHLGRVAGHLAFSMQGLRIRLEADDEAAVATLTASSSELASACADAGLRVTGVSVGRPLSGVVPGRPIAASITAAGTAA